MAWEGSAADRRIDRREAKKRGMTQKQWEGSPADERLDAGAQKTPRGARAQLDDNTRMMKSGMVSPRAAARHGLKDEGAGKSSGVLKPRAIDQTGKNKRPMKPTKSGGAIAAEVSPVRAGEINMAPGKAKTDGLARVKGSNKAGALRNQPSRVMGNAADQGALYGTRARNS